jgi:FKBP-type peptidyl-prolyl cis-trans isomerase
MKHSYYFIAVAALLLASCSQPFKKTDNGIEYKIISEGKGDLIKAGNFFEIQFEQRYKGSNKDTLLFSSKDFSNQVVALDSNSIPPVYFKIFKQIRKGDSIVVKQLTDSVLKQGANGMPTFIKKGAFITSYYKIVNIYLTRESADSAYKLQMLMAKSKDSLKAIDQLKKDDKKITDYLAANKIQAVKAPQGTYVQIINPGEGDVLDSSKVLKVLYTGKTLEDGKVFDSNKDPKFNHTDLLPITFNLPAGAPGSVIKGMTDGLSLLKKGAKAVLYIPSSLAYGAQGAGGDIKANANLIFEVEIVEAIPAAQAKAEEEAKRKVMEAMQKKAMDSVQKTQKK